MKLLSTARDLRRRKARERQSLFVAEGVRAVGELLRSPLEIRGVLIGPQLAENEAHSPLLARIAAAQIPIEYLNEQDFESASDTDSPQGILAIAAVPPRRITDLPDAGPLRLLVLDAVQDPGNVGTILRTGAALGATATMALPGTVDLWNAKVVRSGMGAHFHHLCFSGTWDELDTFRATSGVALWAADASGEAIDRDAAVERLALVVGNEGAGVSRETRSRADRFVALPIAPSIESLNVAVATGILLYELRQ